jgi:hypothetical protein
MTTLEELFDALWAGYAAVTPDAARVQSLLRARGETVVNDHVAFRTFDLPPVDLSTLAAPLVALGYEESGRYRFEEKKLEARSFRHPSGRYPRVFISELVTARFSPWLREIAGRMVGHVDPKRAGTLELLAAGAVWGPIAHAEYLRLAGESEYAAWLAAFGFRANHFTVSLNALRGFPDIRAFNAWLKEQGFVLNASGGEVKGTPAELLEQSSTQAPLVEWNFAGGEAHRVPTCYYEFARRYLDPKTGRPYDGFVPASADRIFESTNALRS